MNQLQPSRRKFSIIHHWLVAAAALLAGSLPVAQAVDIKQAPLTSALQLQPNVVLMFDDSGSMRWNAMPDSLSNTETDKGFISSGVNGVYYNPSITYDPPYTSTAKPPLVTTRYAVSNYSAAPFDGFDSGAGTTNIGTYNTGSNPIPGTPNGTTSCSGSGTSTRCYLESVNFGRANPDFTHLFRVAIPTQYQFSGLSSVCADGSTPNAAGKCPTIQAVSELPLCQGYGNGDYSNSNDRCSSRSGSRSDPCGSTNRTPGLVNSAGLTLQASIDRCTGNLTVFLERPCPTGFTANPDSGGNASLACRKETAAAATKYRSLFVYATKNTDNTYTHRYVGAATEDTSGNGAANLPKAGSCSSISQGTVTSDTVVYRVNSADTVLETFNGGFPSSRCDSSDATRLNVANWFTYYRTRLLMAKSGLMNAFVDLDEDIRFGFSSINAGTGNSPNGSNLPTPKTNTTYDQSISNASYSPPISKVKRFGNGATDTRRGEFWNWLSGVTSPGSTPLRAALKATGDYYQGDDSPWLSGTNAPECSGRTGSDLTNCGNRMLACRQAYTILVTDGYWNSDNVTLSGGNYLIDGSDYGGNWDAGPGATVSTTQTATPTCSGVYNGPYTGSNPSSLTGQCYLGTGRGTNCDAGSGSRNSSCFRLPDCAAGYTRNTSGSGYVCERTTTSTAASVTNSGPNGLSYIYSNLAPYSGGQTNNSSSTLADVAMFFWLKDLRSDLANSVPTNSDDPAFWQHMTTFTVGMFGQDAALPDVTPSGTTADAIFAWARGGTPISNFAWPTPETSGSSENISDLVHAGLNGRGGFYSAGNPEAFAAGIKDALRRVRDRVGSGASLAANSTKLDTGTTTYQAVYFSGEWKGNLRAFAVNPGTGAIATVATWEATTQLPAAASRNIKTCKSTCTGNDHLIGFDTANATTDQRAALGTTATQQDSVINYLRGSSAAEARSGGTLRNRTTPLGDIVNSQPVFVGAPDPNLFFNKTFTGASTYFDFAASKATRAKRIYVAANDGMLHGFSSDASGSNPSPGQETFAYLPNAVIVKGNLKNLSNPAYGFGIAHEFFNDGELTVSDVYLNGFGGCTGVACWRTVLIGTTGRGLSKAVYALDVTDPADVKLLWERDANDSDYIGQIIGKPVVAQTANGVWSVLIGNGYNSVHNKPALLQFNVQNGDLSVHSTTGSSSNDGLAPPAVWIGNVSQNVSTEAYAGDLNGNVWKFDLSSSTSAGTKIYIAKDHDGNTQPITAGLIAGRNPKVLTESEVWVFFGTGSILGEFAPTTVVQTWYGLIVQGTNAVGSGSVRETHLKQRTIDVEFAADSVRLLATRGISSAVSGDMAGKKGWYIDLLKPTSSGRVAQGERMVTPNQFQGTLLLGTSRVPADAATFDPCNPSGSGWIMVVDPFTGAPPTSNFFDVSGDGSFNATDNAGGGSYVSAGIGFGSIPNNPIFVGNTMLISFDNATTGSVKTRGTAGALQRQSWRELVAP